MCYCPRPTPKRDHPSNLLFYTHAVTNCNTETTSRRWTDASRAAVSPFLFIDDL